MLAEFLSPMMLDWPRFWRERYSSDNQTIAEYIDKMNDNPAFDGYYDNAIRFAAFSEKYANWSELINRDGMTDIIDFYKRVESWYNTTQ